MNRFRKQRDGTRREKAAMKTTYQCMDEVNFSTQILALHPERLAALRVTGVRWNDLGEPKRVMQSLNLAGVRPQWAKAAMPLQKPGPNLLNSAEHVQDASELS